MPFRRIIWLLNHFADLFLLSRVSVNPECVLKYNELKLEKKLKYIIYRLSDDYKEIIVEDASSDGDWEVFQGKLLNAKASHKGREGKGPRFAVYDFEYELGGGEGTRYAWYPCSARGRILIKIAETSLCSSRGPRMRARSSS